MRFGNGPLAVTPADTLKDLEFIEKQEPVHHPDDKIHGVTRLQPQGVPYGLGHGDLPLT